LSKLSILPLYTNNFRSWIPFQPKVVLGLPARRVLTALAAASSKYGALLVLKPGPWRAEMGL
jgi:hypothetical protein